MKGHSGSNSEQSALIDNGADLIDQRPLSLAGLKSRWARILSRTSIDEVNVDQATLLQALSTEKKRCERTGRRFALVILRCAGFGNAKGKAVAGLVNQAVCPVVRDTDLLGWYEEGVALGILFTEVGSEGAVASVLMTRIREALSRRLNPSLLAEITVGCHISVEGRFDTELDSGRKLGSFSGKEEISVRAQASPQNAS